MTEKQTLEIGKGKPGPGRPKGVPNKTTQLLKDAILKAAEEAGGPDGIVGYLKRQAEANPQSFLPLLGKVLPMQIVGDPDNPIHHKHEIDAERFTRAIAGLAARRGEDGTTQ